MSINVIFHLFIHNFSFAGSPISWQLSFFLHISFLLFHCLHSALSNEFRAKLQAFNSPVIESSLIRVATIKLACKKWKKKKKMYGMLRAMTAIRIIMICSMRARKVWLFFTRAFIYFQVNALEISAIFAGVFTVWENHIKWNTKLNWQFHVENCNAVGRCYCLCAKA